MAKPLQHLYETHHETGSRLRQTLLEKRRGEIFRSWIGIGKKVIDLGCRDGTLTRHFIDDNQVVGCDIDLNALAHARDTYGIETHQVDLNGVLPFKDAEFDVAVMGEVLEHLPYWSITLAQVHRILRGGGGLLAPCHSPIISTIAGTYYAAESYLQLTTQPMFNCFPTMISFPE